MIYFDYNATTPLDPAVREEMLPFLGDNFGNPSSVHALGRRARASLDEARERVAAVWGCKPSEVVFTSGGTESNNLALYGAARLFARKGRHIISSPTEHHAVLHACQDLRNREGFELTLVPVEADGWVAPEAVAAAIRPETILVSIMAANNETGTLQPVAKIGRICRERGVCFHTDAVQVFGKEPFHSIHQFEADLVAACAHKFHGPKGAGALFIRSPLLPPSILQGGAQENERRPGTENLAAIVGFAAATERFVKDPVFPAERLRDWTSRVAALADSIPGVSVRGSRTRRLANTLALTAASCDSLSILANLDLEGVCASSGSACSSGALEPSHVLSAMGLSRSEASSLVRLSLGRENTEAEVLRVIELLPAIVERVRGASLNRE